MTNETNRPDGKKIAFDPFEIEFAPEFEEGRGPREPFVNEFGVVIGDHDYESAHSPLEQWDENTDPSVMAGDQWVHPFKDIGFHTAENKDYFERGIPPQGGIFMHPDKDVAYPAYRGEAGAEEAGVAGPGSREAAEVEEDSSGREA